jgi:hypothetical protein
LTPRCEAVDEPRPGIEDRQSDETLRPAGADIEDQNVDIRATPKHEGSPGNEGSDAVERQHSLGKELAKDFDGKVGKEIDETLDKVNPRFDRTKSAYRENCTSVVQATEIRRRGSDVEAGPLEKDLRKDEGGPGGQPLSVIEQAWDRSFTMLAGMYGTWTGSRHQPSSTPRTTSRMVTALNTFDWTTALPRPIAPSTAS